MADAREIRHLFFDFFHTTSESMQKTFNAKTRRGQAASKCGGKRRSLQALVPASSSRRANSAVVSGVTDRRDCLTSFISFSA